MRKDKPFWTDYGIDFYIESGENGEPQIRCYEGDQYVFDASVDQVRHLWWCRSELEALKALEDAIARIKSQPAATKGGA